MQLSRAVFFFFSFTMARTKEACPHLTDMEVLRNDINYVKSELKETNGLLKEFIKAADEKYATKLELSYIHERIADNKTMLNKVIDLAIKIGPWIIITIFLVTGKVVL